MRRNPTVLIRAFPRGTWLESLSLLAIPRSQSHRTDQGNSEAWGWLLACIVALPLFLSQSHPTDQGNSEVYGQFLPRLQSVEVAILQY